ncbi:MAG TPA: hypothetical protein DDW81_16855, partial [Cryomorphaceae bacterium]|nr:hypothetical protein [Cryomorphaceae bacterium]
MKRKYIRKVLLWTGGIVGAFLLGIGLFFLLVSWEAFGPLPDKEELKDIHHATATLVFSADQKLIGKIFEENRTNVSYEQFPQNLIHALVATEDARFFEHEGVDNRSVLRVLFKSILLGDRSSGGGSTLTQQLAKNLYGRRNFGFLTMPVNKVKEMILANRIEEIYSKEEILQLYLNTVSFSENVYGIGEGSRRFFGKEVKDLHSEESAVLVGILKANTYYNPRLHPDHALGRRNVVLNQMLRYGYLSAEEADSLRGLPLELSYKNIADASPAPYFMKHVRNNAAVLLQDKARSNGTPYDIEKDGLRIYTSLNYAMQSYANQSLKEHLGGLQSAFDKYGDGKDPMRTHRSLFEQELKKSISYRNLERKKLSKDSMEYYLDRKHPVQVYYRGRDTVLEMSIRDSVAYYVKMLQGAFFALNPQSGAVLCWVGGLDHQLLPYDHVMAHRQSASTFKPIVYATALEQGIDPCEYIENERRVYENYEDWSPRNYDNEYGGMYSMKGALKKSINVAAVKTVFETGINNVIVTARRMGIDSKLPENPSVALGTGSVTLYEMVKAYGVFANNGFSVQPYFIEKITTATGEVLYERTKGPRGELVINPDNARLMTEMLKAVVDEGTGYRLRGTYGLRNDLAGKTGTAQNYTDGWFIGYNPSVV